jgi:hypothetical protein
MLFEADEDAYTTPHDSIQYVQYQLDHILSLDIALEIIHAADRDWTQIRDSRVVEVH